MIIATPLAILFLFITAAWTGIFAIAFARQKPGQRRTLLADCFWIGVPAFCMLAAAALLMQPGAGAEQAVDSLNDSHERTHASVAEHKQECIRDWQRDRIAMQSTTVLPTSGAGSDTAARSTLRR